MGRFSKLELGEGQPGPEGRGLEKPAHVSEESPLARPEEDYDAHGHLRRGQDLLCEGEPLEALRAFSRALKLDSRMHEAWLGQIDAQADIAAESGRGQDLRQAEHLTTAALEQFPDDPALLSMRGVFLARQGMLKRALGTSDYAQGKGHTVRGWISRGEILLIAGNSNAHFCLEKALEQVGDHDWQTLMQVGLVWHRNRHPAKAVEIFQRAIAARPGSARIWRLIAECQARIGQTAQAIESCKHALEIAPEDRRSEDMLARLTKSGPLRSLWRRLWRR